jgi:hypothetical protein
MIVEKLTDKIDTARIATRMTVDDMFGTAGFKPAKLFRGRTHYSPFVPKPRLVMATVDESGMAEIGPETIAKLSPSLVERIELFASSVRLAGLPVMVLVVDAKPKGEADA